MADILIENHCSIFLLRSAASAGQGWLDSNVQSDAPTFGNAIVCEPRYVSDIEQGAQAVGFAVA
jgi:hypothetical protein